MLISGNDTFNCLQIGAGWLPEQTGGLNRYFYDLVHHLPTAGVRCQLLVAGQSKSWPGKGDVRPQAFASLELPLWKRWAAERRAVAKLLAMQSPDVAVAHFALYAFPVLRQLRAGRPFVVHFHGPWAEEARREGAGRSACAFKKAIERIVYRQADLLIVLSSAFKDILINNYGIPEDRVRIVPGGTVCPRFDVAEDRREARQSLGWPADRPTVLTVRRLTQRMGLDNLIEAAAEVRNAVPDVLFLIAGGGGQRSYLEQLIHKYGLDDTVRLLGFVPDDDLPLAYRAADLTVVPSVALEGFGLVAAESLAAGTPVMATPVGGLVELLGPLSSAMLFKSSTPEDMASGLSAVLQKQVTLPTAAEGAAYASRRFDWSVVTMQIADVYREAIEHYRPTNL